jgi:hypothetical protein
MSNHKSCVETTDDSETELKISDIKTTKPATSQVEGRKEADVQRRASSGIAAPTVSQSKLTREPPFGTQNQLILHQLEPPEGEVALTSFSIERNRTNITEPPSPPRVRRRRLFKPNQLVKLASRSAVRALAMEF